MKNKKWTYKKENQIRFDPMTGERIDKAEHWITENQDGIDYSVAILSQYKQDVETNGRLIESAPNMFKLLENIVQSAPMAGLSLALEKDIQAAASILTHIRGHL